MTLGRRVLIKNLNPELTLSDDAEMTLNQTQFVSILNYK